MKFKKLLALLMALALVLTSFSFASAEEVVEVPEEQVAVEEVAAEAAPEAPAADEVVEAAEEQAAVEESTDGALDGEPEEGDAQEDAKDEYLQYSVSFLDMKGEKLAEPQTVDAGGTATKPADPVIAHETFKYWATKNVENNQEVYTEFNFSTEINQNYTLYAITEKVKIAVTFDSNGGSEVAGQTVEYGGKIDGTAALAAAKEGCELVGWFNGETEWNFDDALKIDAKTLTLTAQWEDKYYDVTFATGEGASTVEKQSVKHGPWLFAVCRYMLKTGMNRKRFRLR